jgi:dihydropteroate synthase
VIDVGAVSTRPGSAPVDPDEEWRRLEPVLGPLRSQIDVPLSLDTTCALTLERVVERTGGVDLLNDTSALADDRALAPLVAELQLPVVLMHRRGRPQTMQDDPCYGDVVDEVLGELSECVERALGAGIPAERILLDPGIGFGKRLEDNLALLSALPRLVALGHRTVLGCSRKSFLGELTGAPVEDREHATTATTVLAALAGIDYVRVHDVGAARQALAVIEAVGVVSKSFPG